MSRQTALRVVVGLGVSALFIVLLLRELDADEVGEAFRGVEWRWVVVAAVPFAAGLWVRALRWRIVLRPAVAVPRSEAASLVVIGLAANNLLPIRAGEVVRAVLVERRHGGSRLLVLGTIVVERVFDGLVLALFLAVTLATAGSNDVLRVLAAIAGVGFVVATAVLAALAARPESTSRRMVSLLALAPARVRPRARAWLGSFLGGLGQLRGASQWGAVVGATALSWGLEACAYWLVGEAFGLGVDPWLYLGVAGASNLAIAAPSTAGGIGPFEYFAREVLVVFGVGTATATAYAIALHVLILVPVVVAGLLLLWQRHLGPAVLAHPERVAAEVGEPLEVPR